MATICHKFIEIKWEVHLKAMRTWQQETKRKSLLFHNFLLCHSLTTSFFKRKPDNDTAAMEYESAAKAYQYAKQPKQTIMAFLKAAEAHSAESQFYPAAKHLEAAAAIEAKDLKHPEKAAELYVKSCHFYRRNNNGDRATDVLEKAGKVMETVSADAAVEYYKQACELYEAEDRLRLGLNTIQKVIGLYVSSGKLGDALAFSKKNNEVLIKANGKHLTMRGYLSTIIIALAMGDEVEASKLDGQFANQDAGWMRSDEGQIAESLLKGFADRDEALVDSTVKKQFVGFLDNEVSVFNLYYFDLVRL